MPRRSVEAGIYLPNDASGEGEGCQNSLPCAPCCAALSLKNNSNVTNLRPSGTAGKGVADDRHPAELSPTCGVYRGGEPDRSGAADRPVPGRVPAAGSGEALCL